MASLDLPAALADCAHGEPLVSSIAGTGTTLEWSRVTASLVAVVGLDGIRWL